ncbi:MAG: hypothetical protein Q8K70_09805 [Bacteroidota bacterium]|nr:hypothetical protein [Bacteroidota bacterium]
MFYNLENFFDTINDITHLDDDYTPNGKYKWDTKKYQSKIINLSRVLMQSAKKTPDIIGVCEIESKTAIKDLLKHQSFEDEYDFIHYDSPDERGIDVGFIYRKNALKVIDSYPLKISLTKNSKDKTRDILYLKVIVDNKADTLNIMICHLPSRGGGKAKSEQNRIDVAKQIRKHIDKIGINKKWIVMGDFNDEPWDIAITDILKSYDINDYKVNDSNLLNLMWPLKSNKLGTYNYQGKWQILDQMIISASLNQSRGWHYQNESIQIIKQDWMMQTGKYQDFPKRTYIGTKWTNGYSDHLPVKFNLIYNND